MEAWTQVKWSIFSLQYITQPINFKETTWYVRTTLLTRTAKNFQYPFHFLGLVIKAKRIEHRALQIFQEIRMALKVLSTYMTTLIQSFVYLICYWLFDCVVDSKKLSDLLIRELQSQPCKNIRMTYIHKWCFTFSPSLQDSIPSPTYMRRLT